MPRSAKQQQQTTGTPSSTQTGPVLRANGQGPAPPDFSTVNLFKYPAEDGGILDAWLDVRGGQWLFVPGFEDWHAWTGTHWQREETHVVQAEIQELLNTLRRQARQAPKNRRASYVAATRRSRTRVASVEWMARNALFVRANDLDSIDVLNLANGTLNLRSRQLQPHDPADHLTYCLSYDYDPTATAPAWQSALADVDPELAGLLQEFAGYALTADTRHELALWLYGPPGGGKSTILSGLQTMLGPKAGLLGLADIERSSFALSNLPGKTLVVATEQPTQFLASTHVLNAIISGEPVRVERKFRDPIEITPRAKIAWAMNDFPRVSDANNGIFRRVKVLQFPAIPEARRRLELKTLIAGEGSGILNWALDGLDRLQARGHFVVPKGVREATEEFVRENDIPANFVEECCDVGLTLSIGSSDLYKVYRQWALDTGHKPQSQTSIAGDWRRLGFTNRRTMNGVVWDGVDLTLDARSRFGALKMP